MGTNRQCDETKRPGSSRPRVPASVLGRLAALLVLGLGVSTAHAQTPDRLRVSGRLTALVVRVGRLDHSVKAAAARVADARWRVALRRALRTASSADSVELADEALDGVAATFDGLQKRVARARNELAKVNRDSGAASPEARKQLSTRVQKLEKEVDQLERDTLKASRQLDELEIGTAERFALPFPWENTSPSRRNR